MQQKTTGAWYSVEYWKFQIGDEATDKYRLDVDGYSGDAPDGLQYDSGLSQHDGMMFSAYDNDNDFESAGANCADSLKGGWWFNVQYSADLELPVLHRCA